VRLTRIEHTTSKGTCSEIGRSDIDLSNRQGCITVVGEVEEVVGCPGTGEIHLSNLRAIKPEGDLVGGGIERKPV